MMCSAALIAVLHPDDDGHTALHPNRPTWIPTRCLMPLATPVPARYTHKDT